MPVLDNLACTRMALESVLANTDEPAYEVLVVDNGSGDATRRYLEVLAARNRQVRVIRNERQPRVRGGLQPGPRRRRAATCSSCSTTTRSCPRDGFRRLLDHASDDAGVGLVGPSTNRCGNEAQIPVGYDT